MSSPSAIDPIDVAVILKELSSLSKERNNNALGNKKVKFNGHTLSPQPLPASDLGVSALHTNNGISEVDRPEVMEVVEEADAPTPTPCDEVVSVLPGESVDEDGRHTPSDSPVNVLEDELASRVAKSLADMQELLDSVSEDLNVATDSEDIYAATDSEEINLPTDSEDFNAATDSEDFYLEMDEEPERDDDSQNEIIDLTLPSLGRETINEEMEEERASTIVTRSVDGEDADSHMSYDSVREQRRMATDSPDHTLGSEVILGGEMKEEGRMLTEDADGERGSERSYNGSEDSLHRKVESSLVVSTSPVNRPSTPSDNGSDKPNSEGMSSTHGMNSRDELEIYDSRELEDGVHRMMTGSASADVKDHRSTTPPPGSCVPAMFTINQLKRKFDSVDNIMDRIDAGISILRKIEMPARESLTDEPRAAENKQTSSSDDQEVSGAQATDDNTSSHRSESVTQLTSRPYSKSTPNLDSWQTALSTVSYTKPSFLQDIRVGNQMPLSEDDALDDDDEDDNLGDVSSLLSGADNHSDLDSDAAIATDAKFSEILRSKHSTLGDPRIAALKHHEGAIETESIRTEDFESAFQTSLPADHSLRSLQTRSLAEESTDTPLTEDFEERFKSSVYQVNGGGTQKRVVPNYPQPRPPSRTSPVNRRHTPTNRRTPPPPKRSASKNSGYSGLSKTKATDVEIQLGVDTLDELSDMEPEVRRRARPTSPHHAAPIVPNGYYEADSESEDGDFAKQIREQSSRIQKEIELERRLKSRQAQRVSNQNPQFAEFPASGQAGYNSLDSRVPRYRVSTSYSNLPSAQDLALHNNYSVSTPDVPSLFTAPKQQMSQMMSAQVEEDANVIQRLSNDRLQLLQEINRLQEELKRLEDEVNSSELQAKENRTRAEESRSHLMVAEFKKEAVLKEINRLSAEVAQGKRIIEEAQERKEQEDITLNKLGITIQQVPAILEERDELKQQIENMERLGEKDKDDMCKQVQDAKTEASIMQDNMQEKVETLRDSVQRLNTQLERLSREKDEFKKERDAAIAKCDSLQRDMAAGEHAKAQALEQTIKGYDDMRRRLEKESAETLSQLSKEAKGTKKLLEIEEQKCSKLREEIELRDQLNVSLREQLHNVRQKAIEEEESHDNLLKELKKQLRDADTERLAAWDACKGQFEVEKDKLLEATRVDLERQHEEMLTAVREEYTRHMTQLQHSAKSKEGEAHALRDRLSQQEQESRRAMEALRADTRQQVEDAVKSEKKIWEKEQKYQENEQLKLYREKEENQVAQLRLQLESENRKRQQLEDSLSATKDDLEDSQQYSSKLQQDKQNALQKLKQVENNQGNEIDKSKHELKQHYEKIVGSMREEMEERDQELERLRMENSSIVQSEAESGQALEKFEKMIINEMNEECSKTADLLGVQPRKAQTVSFSRSSSPSKVRAKKRTTSRSLTASAVANLRACNEELRNSLSELKSEVGDLSEVAERSDKAKEIELEQLRNRLNNEKRQEIEDMRTSLAKMPTCRRSLAEPRDPYQVKLERKASEKALRKSLSESYSKMNGTSPDLHSMAVDDLHESSATNCMQSVQDRLKHIRAGSPFRYRSNPMLSSPPEANKYSSAHSLSTAGMDSLEQKIRLAELKARLADERASRNQAMLSQKMHEVNELQHTLNSQTKEILGLERSYDDLRTAQYSPTRYSLLNSTFPH